jgi:hypothetical protein
LTTTRGLPAVSSDFKSILIVSVFFDTFVMALTFATVERRIDHVAVTLALWAIVDVVAIRHLQTAARKHSGGFAEED